MDSVGAGRDDRRVDTWGSSGRGARVGGPRSLDLVDKFTSLGNMG